MPLYCANSSHFPHSRTFHSSKQSRTFQRSLIPHIPFIQTVTYIPKSTHSTHSIHTISHVHTSHDTILCQLMHSIHSSTFHQTRTFQRSYLPHTYFSIQIPTIPYIPFLASCQYISFHTLPTLGIVPIHIISYIPILGIVPTHIISNSMS